MYTEGDIMVEQVPWQTPLLESCSLLKDWGNSTPQVDHHLHHQRLYIDAPAPQFDYDGFQSTPVSVLDYVQQSEAEDARSSSTITHQQQQFTMEELEIQELLAGFISQAPPQELVDSAMVDKLACELEGEILSSRSDEPIVVTPNFLYYNFPQDLYPNNNNNNNQTAIMSPTHSRISSQGSSVHHPTYHNHQFNHCIVDHQCQQQQQYSTSFQEQHKTFASSRLVEVDSSSSPQEHMMINPRLHNHHQYQYQDQQPPQQYNVNFQAPPPKLLGPVDQQIYLVRMLLTCANAVSDRNLEMASTILVQLRSMVVPQGSPMQRLASYVAEALAARLSSNTRSTQFKGLVANQLQKLNSTTRSDMLEAFGVFYEYIPIGKFTHLTMNQILLEAAEREQAVHVIDFQVWYGAQWPSFLQSLAMRPGGPPVVRMTAVGASLRDLEEAGAKLHDCARGLGVPFEYCMINVPSLEQFHAAMVQLREGEAVMVNSLCQFHCFLKREESVEHFLLGIRTWRPKLVVMAENDAEHNGGTFLNRFMACLQYYSAVFDAFDASLPMPTTSQGRRKLEELIAAQKLRNMIACEGIDRVERHESLHTWHSRMERAGFKAVTMSNMAISQANLLLQLYFPDGYTMSNHDGFLQLGWRGVPLNGVGAWIS